MMNKRAQKLATKNKRRYRKEKNVPFMAVEGSWEEVREFISQVVQTPTFGLVRLFLDT